MTSNPMLSLMNSVVILAKSLWECECFIWGFIFKTYDKQSHTNEQQKADTNPSGMVNFLTPLIEQRPQHIWTITTWI